MKEKIEIESRIFFHEWNFNEKIFLPFIHSIYNVDNVTPLASAISFHGKL